ncbi:MAG: hypothetical protein AAF581_06710 [Planctomycetota bacterium]
MSIEICNHSFEGPYTDTSDLKEQGGVYVILDKRSNAKWTVIDVGQSSGVKSRVDSHDRKDCWTRNQRGTLGVAVMYTPGWSEQQREALERKIREAYTPMCGIR